MNIASGSSPNSGRRERGMPSLVTAQGVEPVVSMGDAADGFQRFGACLAEYPFHRSLERLDIVERVLAESIFRRSAVVSLGPAWVIGDALGYFPAVARVDHDSSARICFHSRCRVRIRDRSVFPWCLMIGYLARRKKGLPIPGQSLCFTLRQAGRNSQRAPAKLDAFSPAILPELYA